MRSTYYATHVYPPPPPETCESYCDAGPDDCELEQEACLKPRSAEDIKANVRILTTPVGAERSEGQPITMWAVVEKRTCEHNGESLMVTSVHEDFASASNCAKLLLVELNDLMKGMGGLPLRREKVGEFDTVTFGFTGKHPDIVTVGVMVAQTRLER